MSQIILAILLAAAAVHAAVTAPAPTSHKILDPNNDFGRFTHGIIVSSDRIVLKLDCPLCPKYNESWPGKSTSLIYDFAITYDTSRPDERRPTGISLHGDDFFPYRGGGLIDFLGSSVLPVPEDASLISYLWRPIHHEKVAYVGNVAPATVKNNHGWNITCYGLLSINYDDQQESENRPRVPRVGYIELFVRKTARSTAAQDGRQMELRDLASTEEWSLDWWRILPLAHPEVMGPSEIEIPKGLEDKLLGKSTASPCPMAETARHRIHHKIGPWNPFQIWMLAAAVVSCFAAFGILVCWAVGEMRRAVVRRCMFACQKDEVDRLMTYDEYMYMNDDTGDYIQKVELMADE